MPSAKGAKKADKPVAKAAKAAAPAKKAAAAPPMTKTALIAHFAGKFPSLPKTQVKGFFDELADLAAKEAKKGFTIPGIGKLVIREYKARMGRNPRTGEQIKIKARKRLKFVVSSACKKAAGFDK